VLFPLAATFWRVKMLRIAKETISPLMQMPAMALVPVFSPFGAKNATTPKINPLTTNSEQTAPSRGIPTGLPLRARWPNRYTAMLKQGATRLNNAA